MVSVGQRLQDERVALGLSIDMVARATKIRPQFIAALEKGDYAKLPSKAYAQGFIKNYIAFLGLPQKELLAKFRREYDRREEQRVLPGSFTSEREIKPRRFYLLPSIFAGIGIALTAGGYMLFQYRAAFFSPGLEVVSPKEGTVISTDNIVVSGSSDSNALVSVNGMSVPVDEKGNFQKTITVFSGSVTITVRSVNNFGKTNQIIRHVSVK